MSAEAAASDIDGADDNAAITPTKRRLDPGAKRNLVLVGGAVAASVAVVLAMLFMGGSKKAPQQNMASDLQVGAGSAQQADNLTPAMQAKLSEKQAADAAAAAAAQKSYIPPDAMPARPLDAPAVQQQSLYSQGVAPVAGPQQGLSDEDRMRREGLRRQLGALLGEGGSEESLRQSLRVDLKSAGGSTATPAVAPGQTASAAASAVRVVVPGLEIAAAEIANDIRVPENGTGHASARIVSGPAAGAFLIGRAKVADEMLEVTFTQMRLNNVMYQVDAIVLDQTTANNAIAGSVDRRVLQRYVLPIALAVAQGFASASAQTGSEATSTAGGVIATAPAPSLDQARSAGVAAGLQIAAQEVQRGAQKPVVVSVPARTQVGLLFRAPVTEKQ